MAKVSIKVLGPWPAWDGTARSGRLERADGTRAAVLLHPDSSGAPADLAAMRDEGRHIGAVRHPHVLHLKQVLQVGPTPMWVHDGFDGASLARVVQELAAKGRRVPLRAVVEVGAAVVDAVGDTHTTSLTTGRPIVHPGVTPGHVLLSRSGALKVAGFRAPPAGAEVSSPTGYRPPESALRAPGLVYGVGALLVELLGGELPPAAAPDAERHAATVRRALIRVISRPGARVPEAVVEILRLCLAFAPERRPSLPRLAVELCRIAEDLPQQGLEAWAKEVLPGMWSRLVAAAPSAGGPPAGEPSTSEPPVRGLPMQVGPMPGPMPAPVAGTVAGTIEADLGERATTESGTSKLGMLSQDAPTENETEEVERTAEVAEAPAEVTVATPAPAPAPAQEPAPESTVMSRFVVPARGPGTIAPGGPGPLPAPGPLPGPGALPGPASLPGPGAGPAVGEDLDEELEWRPRRRSGPALAALVLVLAVAGGGLWWSRRPAGPADPSAAAPPASAPSAAAAPEDEPGVVTGPPSTEEPAAEPSGEEALGEEATGEGAEEEAAAPPPGAASVVPPVAAPAGEPTSTAARSTRAESSAARQAPPSPARPGRAELVEAAAGALRGESQALPGGEQGGTSGGSDPQPTTVIVIEQPAAPASAVVAPAPAEPPYTLRFTSAYDPISRMSVECHGGRSGSGLSITIPDAVPGPCKVEATTVDGGRLVALVSATQDRSWSCFANGERTCR